MASIIKEKSMGRTAEIERKGSRTGRSGKGLPVFYAGIWLKLHTSRHRIISVKSVSLSLLVLFSALFLIYCRTGSQSLHELSSPETAVPTTVLLEPQTDRAEESAEEESFVPDLTPVNKLRSIKYDPQVLRGVFWRESDFSGEYFLTFDDGPNRQIIAESGLTVCESILDSLAVYGHRAVFFINGKNLVYRDKDEKKELRAVLQRIIAEGHILGNHSYSHHNLARGIYADGEHDALDVKDELVRTQAALDEILGFSYPMILVRPPYAEPGRSDVLDKILSRNGQFLVSLQFDSYDYAYKEDGRWNASTIAARVMSLMEEQPEGGVLLLHELDSTARILPGLLDDFNSRKMRMGKLEDHLYRKYAKKTAAASETEARPQLDKL